MSDLVERTLRHRVDGVEPVLQEVGPERIVERARQVRRRRRAVASGVIGVLLVAAAGQLLRVTAPPPTGIASHGRADGVAVDRLPRGRAPQIGYTDGARFHLAGGRLVPVPGRRALDTWLPYAGGLLVADQDSGELRHFVGGRVVDRMTHGTFAVSADGAQVARADAVSVKVGPAGGGTTWTMPVTNGENVVGFVARGTVVMNSYRPLVVDGTFLRELGGLGFVSAANQHGLVAGTLVKHDSTYAVADTNGHVLWTTRQELGSFSPDGRHILGLGPALGASRRLQVLDARTGKLVRQLAFDNQWRNYGDTAVWEDDTDVLTAAVDVRDRIQALVRLRADGTAELASKVRGWKQATYLFERRP